MGVNRIKDGAGKPVTIECVGTLYAFLQGADVAGISNLGRSRPKLSSRAAFSVIYVLQEHLDLIPDTIERCTRCGGLFDSEQEGDRTDDKSLCDSCCA